MKIKVWNAITNIGYGEQHTHQYPSLEVMIEDLGLTDVDVHNGDGSAFDANDYWVDISTSIFDTTGYEVVEE